MLSTNNKERFFRFIKNKFWEINPKKILLNKKTYLNNLLVGIIVIPVIMKNYKVPDNFYGSKNFKTYTSWIQNNKIDLSREITYLKKWINSKSFSYHSWKIENNNWLTKINYSLKQSQCTGSPKLTFFVITFPIMSL